MSENVTPFSPECEEGFEPAVCDRRGFIRVLGGGTPAVLGLGGLPAGAAAAPPEGTANAKPS
jgi:hypothetical protein